MEAQTQEAEGPVGFGREALERDLALLFRFRERDSPFLFGISLSGVGGPANAPRKTACKRSCASLSAAFDFIVSPMKNRQPFKYGRRTCIFCGGTGMSKEHIWARWMIPYLPKDAPNYSSVNVVVHRTHETKKEKTENRSAYSGTIKLVCETCNNGWMSQLQNNAKPILLPLMKGERPQLNRNNQKILAAWIAMFIMVAEFQVPDKVAIQPEARNRFKESRHPPDHWAIWVGVYNRQKWAGITVHSSIAVGSEKDGVSARNPDGSARPNTHSTTVVVGKLYIHAMGSIFPEFARKNRLDRAGWPMSRLWPRRLKSFAWPTADLTDDQASRISTALIDYYRRKIPNSGTG